MPGPRKPTAILEAKGAFDKNPNRKRSGEPIAEGDAVKPRFVKGRASKVWDEIAPLLRNMGTLKAVDSIAFGTFCCLQAEFEKNPREMTAARITQKRFYEERFGMNPSARAKMAVEGEGKSKDPAERYFGNPDGPDARVLQ